MNVRPVHAPRIGPVSPREFLQRKAGNEARCGRPAARKEQVEGTLRSAGGERQWAVLAPAEGRGTSIRCQDDEKRSADSLSRGALCASAAPCVSVVGGRARAEPATVPRRWNAICGWSLVAVCHRRMFVSLCTGELAENKSDVHGAGAGECAHKS